jgi:uridine phosphorylase
MTRFHPMRMIFLFLGWNLSLLGVATFLLAGMAGSIGTAIMGSVFVALGAVMSYSLRKTCSSFRSHPPSLPDPKRPLDFYV